MNPLLISTILLASLVIGLMLTWYSTKKELKAAKQKLESLNSMQPFDAKPLIDLQKRVQELEKKVLENVEKELKGAYVFDDTAGQRLLYIKDNSLQGFDYLKKKVYK